MLEGIQSEKGNWESAVKEVLRAQEDLSDLITTLVAQRIKLSLELERTKKLAFEKRKGSLLWPVDGAVVASFGRVVHPVYKTVTVNKGIDIDATKGTLVLSVAQGIVEYVGRMRGYGQFIILNHSGGYLTIYAHLDQVKVANGEQVLLGAIVGTVGETGSLTGPKLHFELRDTEGAIDPIKWLKLVGEPVI